ncbi:helix-turn-helix transcriptional regulator [Actinocatenispora rupis]|uniref:Excisionase n=1 Tax=Actinocatenispora rupis TaxID=519421 RepID=A0A8J3J1Z5_9ACTN|nr:helix-turn-helix domain-containing protein [Actinocatenispora rupis]GID13065.1 excisionase [Actinocatenispora rupis]
MVAPTRPARQARRGFLTVAEVCETLDIARSTFYDWRAKGAIPRVIKLPNGDLRIRASDFETWLETLEAA